MGTIVLQGQFGNAHPRLYNFVSLLGDAQRFMYTNVHHITVYNSKNVRGKTG